MPAGSSPKRERQYEHIKESAKGRGGSEGTAERIAAATVHKRGNIKGRSSMTKSQLERAVGG